MKTAVEDFTSKQIHENSEASKKNGQKKEKLEDSGEKERILARAVTLANIDALDLPVHQADQQIVLSIGVTIILAKHVRSYARAKRPIFAPMKIDRWLSQGCHNLVARHARLYRQQILIDEPLFAPLRQALASVPPSRGDEGVSDEQKNRQSGQHVNPQASPRKKRLPHLQPDHRLDLRPPDSHRPTFHRAASSFPIKYSYTDSTSSSAGAIDSTSNPFTANWFSAR